MGYPVSDSSIEISYREDTRSLTARRVPAANALFLTILGAAHILVWRDQPENAWALTALYAIYVLLAAAQLAIARWTRFAVIATIAATNARTLSIGFYYGLMQADSSLMALGFALLLIGSGIFYPLGARGQFGSSLGAIVGYPLALALGAQGGAASEYGALTVTTAVLSGILASHFLETQRRAVFLRTTELAREQRMSAALLLLSSQLSSALDDPALLAARLVDGTRAALGADWALLYERRPGDGKLELLADSRAPTRADGSTLDLELDGQLGRDAEAALATGQPLDIEADAGAGRLTAVLRRWNTARLLLQSIQANGEIVAVLVCCFRESRGPLTQAESRVLGGLGHQASIAFNNAQRLEAVLRPRASALSH